MKTTLWVKTREPISIGCNIIEAWKIKQARPPYVPVAVLPIPAGASVPSRKRISEDADLMQRAPELFSHLFALVLTLEAQGIPLAPRAQKQLARAKRLLEGIIEYKETAE